MVYTENGKRSRIRFCRRKHELTCVQKGGLIVRLFPLLFIEGISSFMRLPFFARDDRKTPRGSHGALGFISLRPGFLSGQKQVEAEWEPPAAYVPPRAFEYRY